MKRSHVYAIVQEYANMPDLGSRSTAKFDYFAYRNNELAQQEIKARENKLKPSKEWLEFEKAREALNQKYAVKDDKGGYVTESRQGQAYYTFAPDTLEARVREMAELESANKDLVAERQAIIDEFNRTMDEDMPQEELARFYRIKLENMPALGKKAASVWGPLVDE